MRDLLAVSYFMVILSLLCLEVYFAGFFFLFFRPPPARG